ncbi:MAG: phosphatase [Sphingomonadales bacterium 32-68-7]|nr:MAG: phosphatase [Sphingomonadales bacterium 32-68-7]
MSEIVQLNGYSDGDVDTNRTDNAHLNDIVAERYSRRQTLMGGATATATAFLGTSLLAACDSDFLSPVAGDSVDAGGALTTSAGRAVTLVGTAASGAGVGVTWTQTAGPTVTLTNANTLSASFIAPAVSAATTLTFQLAAAGGSSDTTTVTVNPIQLGFTAVPKNRNDVVTVPAGYTVTVLTRLGDPIAAGVPAFANNGTDTNYAQRIGDHGDALYWYGLSATGARDDNGSTRGLMVQNHENLNVQYLHPNGPTGVSGAVVARPEAEVIKEIEAHGVSVVEYRDAGNRVWSYVQNSTFNRRITPNTPVVFNGPVRGSAFLRTPYSTDGTAGRGTINNCANGHTLWATNITCEENWAGYFVRSGDDAQRTGGSATTDWRNEPNQYGWCVEFDPYDPTSVPRKRTALGRFGHEGAWYGRFISGRKLAVYLGDDARGEYFYKFVTNAVWDPADAQRTDRLAVGDKYLDQGTLYVAKFNADGTGTWLPLVFGQVPDRPAVGADPAYVFADQIDILVNTRLAGDAVGATKMDRPEWTATSWANGDIYLTLTNNNATLRPLNGTDAANPRHYNDPRGTPATNQFGNPNGHILRLREAQSGGQEDPAATTFTWDIYLFGADSADSNADVNISGLTADNDFSSPDGLWFSRPQNPSGLIRPLLWIQTDDGAFTDRTNNQMLAALPGPTGDGGARTITNVGSGGATATQATRVGAAATAATLKRFLVGPIECEITGVDTTPDGRTLFVGIQHPGENGTPTAPTSAWPASQAGPAPAGTRPRSAIVAITKTDGGVVGL